VRPSGEPAESPRLHNEWELPEGREGAMRGRKFDENKFILMDTTTPNKFDNQVSCRGGTCILYHVYNIVLLHILLYPVLLPLLENAQYCSVSSTAHFTVLHRTVHCSTVVMLTQYCSGAYSFLQYYIDLLARKGLFTSDQAVNLDPRTRPLVVSAQGTKPLFLRSTQNL